MWSNFRLKYALFFIGLFLGFPLSAKSGDPAFHIERYLKTGDTTHLGIALRKISNEFVRYNDPRNKELLLQTQRKAESVNYAQLSVLYSLLRQYYTSEGNRPKTLEYSLKQYKSISHNGNTEELLWILVDIGNMFYDEAEYQQALTFYQKAENIALKQQIISPLPVIYLNFGLVYSEWKDYGNALKYLHKSSEYRIREKNARAAASTFVRIAKVHFQLGNADSVYRYTQLAEDYYFRKNGTDNNLADIPMYIDLSWFDYYALKNEPEKATEAFEKAQQYALKHNMIYDYHNNIFFESKFHSTRGNYRTAVEKLLGTLPFFKKNHLVDEERYIYKMAGSLYSKLNDEKNTAFYLKRYVALDDSIRKSDLKEGLGLMRTIAAVYESDASLERTKKYLQIEKINAVQRGKERNTSIWIAALALSGILVMLGLFINLKKRKKELSSLNRQLENQHRELKVSALELERTNKIKDKLFSIIAHDLRNPLNRLMAELSIAKKRHAEDRFLDPMEITLKETINLFEGLLQWSKLDNSHNIYSPEKVNLCENINKIISFYLPEIQVKQICVVNNSQPIVALADRNILQTLLRNIMSNAIASIAKQDVSGTIEIETVMSETNDTISILFHDSGAGFPNEIIEGFGHSENITNGKGLGLSICKMLARMSGWTMEISNDGKLGGALIALILPAFQDEVNPEEIIIPPLSEAWRSKFASVRDFKFYQTSEIRKFIRSFGEPDDRAAALWLSELEACVHEGNDAYFAELVKKLEDF